VESFVKRLGLLFGWVESKRDLVRSLELLLFGDKLLGNGKEVSHLLSGEGRLKGTHRYIEIDRERIPAITIQLGSQAG
jgi:hypothetical protein